MAPSLPNELFQHILSSASPSTLAILCRTSRTVFPVAEALLYRHVTVTVLEVCTKPYEVGADEDDDVSTTSADYQHYNADAVLCRRLQRFPRLADFVETITIEAEALYSLPDDLLPPIVEQLLQNCRNAVALHLPPSVLCYHYNAEKVATAARQALVGRRSKLEEVTLNFSGSSSLRFLHCLPALRSLTLTDYFDRDRPVARPSQFPFRLEVFRLEAWDVHPDDLLTLLSNSTHSLHTLELSLLQRFDPLSSDPLSCLDQFPSLLSVSIRARWIEEAVPILPSIFHQLGTGSPKLRHLQISQSELPLPEGYIDAEQLHSLGSTLLLELPPSLQSLHLTILSVTPHEILVFIESKRCPALREVMLNDIQGNRGTEEDWAAVVATAGEAGVVLEKRESW